MQGNPRFDIEDQILAEMHLGQLRPGDRLPSIRQLARRTGRDQRTIARAYRELEREGLIEIRGRSGVFVAETAEADVRLSELQRWAAAVALQAWTRRVAVPDLGSLLGELTQTARLRCLFVESSSDQAEQFAAELRDDFGLNVSTLNLRTQNGNKDRGVARKIIAAAAEEIDLIATTVFHASVVHEIAADLNKQLVVIKLSDVAVNRLEELLAVGPLTLVAVDRNHQERIAVLRPRLTGQITVRTVDEFRRGKAAADERVFLTRLAKRAMPAADWPLLFPYGLPMTCTAAARHLCNIIVSTNFSSVARIKESLLRHS